MILLIHYLNDKRVTVTQNGWLATLIQSGKIIIHIMQSITNMLGPLLASAL